MGTRKGQRLVLVAVLGLTGLGSVPLVLGHPPMPPGWPPPPPPMPSIAVYFPPLVLGTPPPYGPVYRGGGPRHYLPHEHPYYREHAYGHRHRRHRHHHEDWD